MSKKRNVPGRRHPTELQQCALHYGANIRMIKGAASMYERQMKSWYVGNYSTALTWIHLITAVMLDRAKSQYEHDRHMLLLRMEKENPQ